MQGMEREGEASHGGMETLEAAVPGRGAVRGRRWRLVLDDAHHVVVIDVRGYETHAGEGYRNLDTLDAAYCDDDHEDERPDVR